MTQRQMLPCCYWTINNVENDQVCCPLDKFCMVVQMYFPVKEFRKSWVSKIKLKARKHDWSRRSRDVAYEEELPVSTSATLNCFAVSAMALTRTHKTTCQGWKHVHGNRLRRRSKDINFQLPPVSISHNTTPKDHLQNKGKTKPFNIKRTQVVIITYLSLTHHLHWSTSQAQGIQ